MLIEPGGEIADRAYRVDRQGPFMEQGFQYPEIREAEAGLFNTRRGVARQRTHRLHHDKPDVLRLLNALGHEKPESSRSIRHQFY